MHLHVYGSKGGRIVQLQEQNLDSEAGWHACHSLGHARPEAAAVLCEGLICQHLQAKRTAPDGHTTQEYIEAVETRHLWCEAGLVHSLHSDRFSVAECRVTFQPN